MKIAFIIVAGTIGLYLALVIPAGVVVLIKEIRFRMATDRDTVLDIIDKYKTSYRIADEQSVIELLLHGKRDEIERDGEKYSIDITAKRSNVPSVYKIIVSVGKSRRITVGHAEEFDVRFMQQG